MRPPCARRLAGGCVSDGIECGCGAILEVAAYVVSDYVVEFEVRKRPGRMDPVEGGDDETTT